MGELNIFDISTDAEFFKAAKEVFLYQYKHVAVYREFCDHLKINSNKINHLTDFPFLPISFFKTHRILAKDRKAKLAFTSSGTTGSKTSTHHVADLDLYTTSFYKGFNMFYHNPKDLVILGLLPSYLEREGSSLIYMVDHLIKASNKPESGFYLDNLDTLRAVIKALEASQKKYVLIGVSFALLDLAELGPLPIKHGIVMETGGMKGRRKELIRAALHKELQKAFGPIAIHSEYGMTELLSQAYSNGEGRFSCPPWMRILIRQTNDPFTYIKGQTGGISVIDLANIHSCSFIATQDLGKQLDCGSFEILGRFDNSDVRGCNLMVI